MHRHGCVYVCVCATAAWLWIYWGCVAGLYSGSDAKKCLARTVCVSYELLRRVYCARSMHMCIWNAEQRMRYTLANTRYKSQFTSTFCRGHTLVKTLRHTCVLLSILHTQRKTTVIGVFFCWLRENRIIITSNQLHSLRRRSDRLQHCCRCAIIPGST